MEEETKTPEMEKKKDEMTDPTSGAVKKVEKCSNCQNYRPDRYSCDGKCLVNKDEDGNFITVRGDENYCDKFKAMPEDPKEDKE